MKIRRISVRSGGRFNHPSESFRNIDLEIYLEADISPSENIDEAIDKLQILADTKYEEHKAKRVQVEMAKRRLLNDQNKPKEIFGFSEPIWPQSAHKQVIASAAMARQAALMGTAVIGVGIGIAPGMIVEVNAPGCVPLPIGSKGIITKVEASRKKIITVDFGNDKEWTILEPFTGLSFKCA